MSMRLKACAFAVAALALNVPAAMADPPDYGCALGAVTVSPGSGRYTGVLVGYAVHIGDVPRIHCYVTVDGVRRAATGVGSGVVADAVTFGPVSGASRVEVCAQVRTTHSITTTCGNTTYSPLPPDEVWDIGDGVAVYVVDPALCSVLAAAPGDYAGGVVIDTDGDVSVLGETRYDCPPYDDWQGDRPRPASVGIYLHT